MMPAQAKEAWSVTVLYEDTAVRERAMRVCDHLMRQFWAEIEFAFNWWRFTFLEDEVLADKAAAETVDADVIIVATQSEGDLPLAARRWLERAVAQRGRREGALIVLVGSEEGVLTDTGKKAEAFLRNVARQAGMDYLTELPSALPGALPRSLDTFSQRADRHSSVMDDILGHLPPPGPSF